MNENVDRLRMKAVSTSKVQCRVGGAAFITVSKLERKEIVDQVN